MRRLPPALAALACTALLAGCGAGHTTPTTTSSQHSGFHLGRPYAVYVFFCSRLVCPADATRSEEHVIAEHLQQEPCVRTVVFTTKAQAWARFKKEHPKLAAAAPAGMGNPLPDSYLVTPHNPSCATAITAAARAAHWPGVQKVVLARRRPGFTPAGS
jgi:hypothetical protein